MNKDLNEPVTEKSTSSSWFHRFLIHAGIVVVAFLAGLVPMWWNSRTCTKQLESTQNTLTISSIQNALANAAVDAKRGEYEPARQAASQFFTKLRAEVDRGNDSFLSADQRNNLQTVFAQRDDTVTLLARSDPAAADRLLDLYQKYRQAVATIKP